jgi:hypothetical protein
MSCGCGDGGGGGKFHPSDSYHYQGAALLGEPPLSTAPPTSGQPDRAPAPTDGDSISWTTWLLIALAVFTYLRSAKQ